jgi:hypothetical protein
MIAFRKLKPLRNIFEIFQGIITIFALMEGEKIKKSQRGGASRQSFEPGISHKVSHLRQVAWKNVKMNVKRDVTTGKMKWNGELQ